MKFGKFEIDVVDTGIFGLDGGSMFGVVPKVLWAKAYDSGDDINRIPLAARCLLVRWEGHNLLVDTGNGTKLDDKIAGHYNIDKKKSSMDLALKPFGLKPSDIDSVVLTHLHFDHAGGAAERINGEIVPAFANAKYYVQKGQLEWALKPSDKDKGSYMADDFSILNYDGLFEKTDGDGELFPGIHLVNVFGHTKNMQMIKLVQGNETILYAADLFATSAHVPYPFILAFDNYPLTTLEEKKKILPQAYEENWTVIYEHDAFIQASKIITAKKGFKAGEGITITKY